MEILINLLIRLPKFPSILYVGTSCAGNRALWQDRLDTPRHYKFGETSQLQNEVARYYHLPYLSLLDGLGPFNTPTKIDFFNYSYRNGNRERHYITHHPSEMGHEIIAATIMHFILIRQYGDGSHPLLTTGSSPSSSPSLDDHRVPQKLMIAKQEELDKYLTGKPIIVDINSNIILII